MNQFAFVLGRSILDIVMVDMEIFHYIQTCS